MAMPRLTRGNSASPRRRSRAAGWVLLGVAVASFLGFGHYFALPHYGNGVGVLDDGTLIVDLDSRYVSEDGGLTWQPAYIGKGDSWRKVWRVDEDWEDTIRWGRESVRTPRGTYAITWGGIDNTYSLGDISIIRIRQDIRNWQNVWTVYRPPHLLSAADVRFRDRYHNAYNYFHWRTPANLVYHAPSGNIVAVLELEGVVIGDDKENWVPLLTEDRTQDYGASFPSKITFVLSGLWPVGIVIAFTATAAALAFSGRPRSGTASLPFIAAALVRLVPLFGVYALIAIDWSFRFEGFLWIVSAIVALLGAAAVWRRRPGSSEFWSLLAGTAVPLIVIVALLGLFVYGIFVPARPVALFFSVASSIISLGAAILIWRKARAVVGMSSLVLACLVSSVGLIFVHTDAPRDAAEELAQLLVNLQYRIPYPIRYLFQPSGTFFTGFAHMIVLSVGLVWSLMAFISFLPLSVRQIPSVLIALCVMTGLVALAFVIGVVQGFNLGAAKIDTVILVIAAVWAFRWYFRNRLPAERGENAG